MGDFTKPALQITGAIIGFSIGGPSGAAIGASIGGAIGETFEDPVQIKGPRINDKRIMSSAYGQPIPLVYGPANRLSGELIWSSGLKEKSKKKKSGGKGGGGGSETTTYSYSADVCILLSEGAKLPGKDPMRNLRRIWANGKLLVDCTGVGTDFEPWTHEPGGTLSKVAFYPGTWDQPVDPTMEAAKGAGNVPAYYGLCHVVLTGLQLADYGNSIPNLEFELDAGDGKLSYILADISERAGLDETEYSISSSINDDDDTYELTFPVKTYEEFVTEFETNDGTKYQIIDGAIANTLVNAVNTDYWRTVAPFSKIISIYAEFTLIDRDLGDPIGIRFDGDTPGEHFFSFVPQAEDDFDSLRRPHINYWDVDFDDSLAEPIYSSELDEGVLHSINADFDYDTGSISYELKRGATALSTGTSTLPAGQVAYVTFGRSSNSLPDRTGIAGFSKLVITGEVPVSNFGYIIARQIDGLSALRPIEQAFAFDTVEQSASVRYVARGRMPIAAIDVEDMIGSDGYPLQTHREKDTDLPQKANITYKDPDRDYQSNTQSAKRSLGSANSHLDAELSMTLRNEQARKILDRMLWEPWVGRMSAAFPLTDRHQFLLPADVVTVQVAGSMTPFRIERDPRGDDGSHQIAAIMDDPFIYDGYSVGASAAVPDNLVAEIPDTFAYAFNAPILYPGEAATAFNWVLDADGDGWRGGQIFRSLDNSVFSAMDSSSTRNTTGTVAAALGQALPDIWDRINTVTVTLHHKEHELESLTELEVLNGKNAGWLGAADGSHGEVFQYATATLISSDPKVYELSDLLRGRRATEHEIALHGPNEIFVFFESGLMATADFGTPDWDRQRYYKGVSNYQFETDITTVQTFTNVGEKAKPRAPVHGRGERDSSDNLIIICVPRIRGYAPGLGYGDVVLDDQSVFECDILVGSSVVRTITSLTPEFNYDAADQIADGITPGAPVDVEIYQISATRGRGHPGVFTV